MNDWPYGHGEMAERIRVHDWASSPVGVREQWPAALRNTVELMLGHGFPMCVLWGDERVAVYNDAYRALMGNRHPAVLGRPLYDVWPEARTSNEPLIAPALAGETVNVKDAPHHDLRHRPDDSAWFDASIAPLHDAAGAVAGVLVTAFETTERVLGQDVLRASEERYRAFVTASADVVYRMSADWSHLHRLDGHGFIVDTSEPSKDWKDRYLLPEDRDIVQRAIDKAIRTRSMFELEHRVIRADGSPGWTLSRAMPVVDAQGDIVEWLGAAKDITSTKIIENALHDSEERYRALFESIDEGFCIIEVIFDEGGRPCDFRFLQINPAFERQTGLVNPVGKTMRELAPSHEQHWFDTYGRVAMSGEPVRFEDAAAALDRWYDVYAFRIGAPEQRRVAVLFRDILVRKRAEMALRESEEQQRFLLKLSDALRPMADPDEVASIACRLLVEHLGGSRAQFAVLHGVPGEEVGEIHGEYVAVGRQVPRGFPLAQYGEPVLSILRAGDSLVVSDIERDPRFDAEMRAAFSAVEAPSTISVPLVKQGEWIGALTTHDRVAREWTRSEVQLVEAVAERTWATFERTRVEAALRESEQRQAFLLELSEALRRLDDPEQIRGTAMRLLGARLHVNRAAYVDSEGEPDGMSVVSTFTRGVDPWIGMIKLSDFGAVLGTQFASGHTVSIDDVRTDPRFADSRQTYAALEIQAAVGVPLLKGGVLVAAMGVHNRTARAWTRSDIATIEGTAERTWAAVERARAERAQQESEYRQRVLVEGMPQLVWRAEDGGCWTWASPQWTACTGQAEADSHGLGWLDAVHPDDRDAARAAWRSARDTGVVEADYRLWHVDSDDYRWFHTRAIAVRDETDSAVEWLGTSTDVEKARSLQERQRVLVGELQHRTRNLMGVIHSIADRTARASADLPDFMARFRERLGALARVQGLLSRMNEHDRVTFDELITTELSAMGSHADRMRLHGPHGVRLRSSTVQMLALALHELATNAVKYGALGQPQGRLAVTWSLDHEGEGGEPWLHIDWRESHVEMPQASLARGGGQGRELIERALPYQLNARTTYALEPDGVHCTVSMPVSSTTAPNAAGR